MACTDFTAMLFEHLGVSMMQSHVLVAGEVQISHYSLCGDIVPADLVEPTTGAI